METSEGEAKETAEKKDDKEKKESNEDKKQESKSTGGLTSSDLVVGEDLNRMVQNIMDMGYGRDEVRFQFHNFDSLII